MTTKAGFWLLDHSTCPMQNMQLCTSIILSKLNNFKKIVGIEINAKQSKFVEILL